MKRAILGSVAVALASGGGAWAGTCSTGANLGGDVIIGNLVPHAVLLSWAVVEDADVVRYDVSRARADCGNSPHCFAPVASLRAGSSGILSAHALIDTPAAGTWAYRLDVVGTHGHPCSYETSLTVPELAPCDAAAVCDQVAASFLGGIAPGALQPGTVRLQWIASAEGFGVSGYRLLRAACADPRACPAVDLATVSAAGACGVAQLHGFTDAPAPGVWSYRLEVLDAGAQAVCAADLALDTSPGH